MTSTEQQTQQGFINGYSHFCKVEDAAKAISTYTDFGIRYE